MRRIPVLPRSTAPLSTSPLRRSALMLTALVTTVLTVPAVPVSASPPEIQQVEEVADAQQPAAAPSAAVQQPTAIQRPTAAPARIAHTVTLDHYSFLVDGKRTYLSSGEFHSYRLPSPDLWLDIFQKMKAAGFNSVSLYFDWGYHSSAPGKFDFTGVRDADKLLTMAEQAGLYVIARPAPYMNAEVDGGGLPTWLSTKNVKNLSNEAEFLRYADEWLTRIDAIIARHQLTNGSGSVIAYQVENEYYKNTANARAYMQHLRDKAEADGITVPLTGNNNGTYNPGTGELEVDGPDSYPQGFDCSNPTRWNGVPDISYDHPADKPLYRGRGECAEHPARQCHTFRWTVTVPADVDPVPASISTTVAGTQNGKPVQYTDERIIGVLPEPPPAGADAVPDLPFLSASNGWGPVERDTNNGEQAAGDGTRITIAGAAFSKGLGTNAPSEVQVYVGRGCSRSSRRSASMTRPEVRGP